MLVGARGRDQAHEPAGIKTRRNKVRRQPVKQLRVRRRVAGPDVVNRINNPDTEEITPHPVNKAAGKIRVLLGGDPVGNQGAARPIFRARALMLVGEPGSSLHAIGILHLSIFFVIDDLLGATGGGEACVGKILGSRSVFPADLGKEGGELPVVFLGPPLKGMVMAFVAAEANTEKELGRVFHDRIGRPQDLVIGGRRILDGRSLGVQQGRDKLVIGHVAGHRTAHPGLQRLRPLPSEPLLVDLQEVGPLVGPEINELGAADKAADKLVAFRLWSPAIEKIGADRLHIRNGAGEIKINPAHELGVG